MKIVKIIQMKIVIFTAVKNRCMLHGRVFVMRNPPARNPREGVVQYQNKERKNRGQMFARDHPLGILPVSIDKVLL